MAAMALGVLASAGGLWASWRLDSAPGATIVLVAIAGFVIVSAAAGVRARLSRPAPTPAAVEPPEVVLR